MHTLHDASYITERLQLPSLPDLNIVKDKSSLHIESLSNLQNITEDSNEPSLQEEVVSYSS